MSHPVPEPNTGAVHITGTPRGDWHVHWTSDPGETEAYLPGPEGLDFDQALAWARSQPAARIVIHNPVP